MNRHIRELLETYSAPDASAAQLLCDNRDPATPDYHLVAAVPHAWRDVGAVVHQPGIPQDQIVLSGMALRHEDADALVNGPVSERVPVEGFTTWHGLTAGRAKRSGAGLFNEERGRENV